MYGDILEDTGEKFQDSILKRIEKNNLKQQEDEDLVRFAQELFT